MTAKDPLIFLEHILENISDIEKFSKGKDKEILKNDIMRQKAIIRSIEVIGEAVRNLPVSFTKDNPEVPWSNIIGMKNKLTHHYFGIDFDIVWKVIEKDIPDLKKKIKDIREDLIIRKKQIENEKNKK